MDREGARKICGSALIKETFMNVDWVVDNHVASRRFAHAELRFRNVPE